VEAPCEDDKLLGQIGHLGRLRVHSVTSSVEFLLMFAQHCSMKLDRPVGRVILRWAHTGEIILSGGEERTQE